jgi:O-antigen/teichoic acid export membrane protein
VRRAAAISGRAQSPELNSAFRRGFAATFALDLITKGVTAATVVVLIRGLSVASYAYATLFLTFAQLVGSAAGSGVRTRYLREEAERLSRALGPDRHGAFVHAFAKSMLLVVVTGSCAGVVAASTGEGRNSGTAALILYGTALAVGYSAVELAIAHLQAKRRFFSAGVLSVLRAAALLGASLGVLATSESDLSISLWFVGVAALVGLATSAPIAWQSANALCGKLHLTWFNREEVWLSVYYFAAAGFAYVDVMVAGALLDERQVATLGASLRYLAIVLGAIPAIASVLRVRTSQVDLIDSPANQKVMVIRWLRRASLPTGLLVISAVVLAPVVIPLIDGGKYPGSVLAFQIFLVTAFVAYLTAPAANILMAQRRYHTLATICGLGLVGNFIGDVAVAREFGVIGIAIVSTAAYVLLNSALVICSVVNVSRMERQWSRI